MSEFADSFPETPRPVRARRKAAPGPKLPRASEDQVQRAIIRALEMCNVYVAHVPNGGARTEATGRYLKTLGVRSGFPDLVCVNHARIAFLEVKGPSGKTSDNQDECHAALKRRGASVTVVASVDEALAACREAGVIK